VRSAMKLVGHRAECSMLDRLVDGVSAGQSLALVLFRASDVAETASPFAGLNQLCASLLAGLDYRVERHGDAPRMAFWMSSEPAPDRGCHYPRSTHG
jgi:hypothetical protein